MVNGKSKKKRNTALIIAAIAALLGGALIAFGRKSTTTQPPTGCTTDVTQMCPDGSTIVTQRCNTTTGVLTPTGNTCPMGCTAPITPPATVTSGVTLTVGGRSGRQSTSCIGAILSCRYNCVLNNTTSQNLRLVVIGYPGDINYTNGNALNHRTIDVPANSSIGLQLNLTPVVNSPAAVGINMIEIWNTNTTGFVEYCDMPRQQWRAGGQLINLYGLYRTERLSSEGDCSQVTFTDVCTGQTVNI